MRALGRGLPSSLRIGLPLVALGISAWSAFTYTGPYRWLAELQLALVGAYLVVVTSVVTMLILTVLLLGAARLALQLGWIAAPDAARAQTAEASAADWSARVARVQSELTVLGIGLVLLFLGGRDLLAAEWGQRRQSLDASQLEHGTEPPSTWLEIVGRPIGEVAVEATALRSS